MVPLNMMFSATSYLELWTANFLYWIFHVLPTKCEIWLFGYYRTLTNLVENYMNSRKVKHVLSSMPTY